MKKIIYILIGIVLISFGIGFLSWNLSGGKLEDLFNMSLNKWNLIDGEDKNYKTLDEKAIKNIDSIDNILISANFARINISSEDRKDISIHYYGKLSSKIKTNLNINSSGNELIIKAQSKNDYKINFGPIMDLYLDIILPTSYKDNIDIQADLGSINLNNLELSKFKINSSLGKISLKDIISEDIELFADLGEVKVENTQGNLMAETNLGSMELDYNTLDWNIDASSKLGSIEIILPTESNFALNAEANLGSIKSSFPFKDKEETKDVTDSSFKGIAGTGENNIKLSVDMGSINIKSQ